MAQVDVPLWRWTRAEYERLVECGFFQPDDRVELIGGQLVVAEPQNSPHVCAVGLTDDVLRGAFGRGWVVRVGHPQRPVLAVEVAESSLASDRTIKGSLYARAGISDYWIINLVDRVVEVYRDPSPDTAAPYGWAYRIAESHQSGAIISPLALPSARIAVADLLP